MNINAPLKESDPEVFKIIQQEKQRQNDCLEMIPSENFVTSAVLEACGSVLNNKYAEGYPFKRYYEGNEHIDTAEQLAIDRAKKLFGCGHVNVQPYSGSPANLAVYLGLLGPREKLMGMRLDMGGHLTHGHKVSATAIYYDSVQYCVDPETHLLDMDAIRKQALAEKPKIIVSGATAYPRIIDFKAFHEIAQEAGAYSFADISHIAGLVAGDAHPSPFPFTDVVMTTTHKTLRGPRAAMIMCKEEFAKDIDKAVFPGLQGGPHEHIIAAKAVAFGEALKPEFKDYAMQIVKNAKAMAGSLMDNGVKLITGGTDNHLMLIDLTAKGTGLGKEAAVALAKAGMVTNANTIPYDKSTPFKPSGIRLGTPALTTRGMKESEMRQIGEWIAKVIDDYKDDALLKKINDEVLEMTRQFPLYE